MAYNRVDAMGGQAIGDVSTTQNHPFGMRVRAYDSTYGYGEFVYVKGVASGAAQDVVTYKPYDGTIVRATTRTKGLIGILQTTLDAATKFGWVQVSGTGIATAGTVASGATCYTTATAGSIDDAVVTGDIIYGMTFASADGTPAAGQALVNMMFPHTMDTDNA